METSKIKSHLQLILSNKNKYQITYIIVGVTVFSLYQFVLPVAAKMTNSTEMSQKQTDFSANKCQFQGHFSTINSINISPDGKIFISASKDNNIKFWNIATGKLIRTFKGVGHKALMSHDGKILISVSDDYTIKLWDISTEKLIHKLTGHSDSIQSLAISKDDKILISSSWDKTTKIWDISTGKLIRTLRGHSQWVNSAIITPDGDTVISGSSDKTIKLWDIKNARKNRTLKVNVEVTNLAVSTDGKKLFSSGYDNLIKVWDIETGKEIRTLKGHYQIIESLAISSDGSTLVSGSLDSTIKLWDIKTGKLLRTFGKPIKPSELSDSLPKNPPSHTLTITYKGSPTQAAISPDGNTIVNSHNNEIQVWDVKTGEQIRTIKGHYDSFKYVKITPDNRTLISLNSDETINFWDIRTQKKIRTIKDRWIRSIAITPDGNTLVTGGWGELTIKLWHIQTGKLIRTFEHNGIDSVAISPNGNILISASTNTIKFWDIVTGKLLHSLEGVFPFILDIATSKYHNSLIFSDVGGKVVLWDISTRKLSRVLKEGLSIDEFVYNNKPLNSLTAIAISPDGSIFVGGYGDGKITLQDTDTTENLRTLQAHSGMVSALAITPDGNTLVSGNYDNTIQVWDIRTGELIRTLEGHQYTISSFTISEDGKTLVSSSYDNTMKMWDMNNGNLLSTFCHSN